MTLFMRPERQKWTEMMDRKASPRVSELTKEAASAIRVAPWMHVVTPGGGAPLDELLPASGSVWVARLDGHEMSDEALTFQHFAERLRFPEYFGWNWNAFFDCLRDLEWLSSDHRILIIESAEHALAEDDEAREAFFRALWRAGRDCSYTKRPEGVTLTKLSVFLSCDEASASALSRQLEEVEERLSR